MREFTKSMFSYTWAMSLFGAQQMLNILSPSKAVKSFEGVASATRGELGQPLQAAFRAGDEMQRRMIDLMFGVISPGRSGDGRRRDASGGQQQSETPGQVGNVVGSATSQGASNQGVTNQSAGNQGAVYAPPSYNQPGGQPSSQGWGAMPVSSPASQPSPGTQPRRDNGGGGGQEQGGEIPHERDISPDYPFEPHYVEVFGSRMHYVEQGTGEPIVFLHGNPTWSYLWRNVLPHVSPHGRCIAPDLIGYGRSDKPDIEYRWSDQAKYVEEFFRKLGLRNVTLVLHDWGVSLGLNYAMRHESNVRAIAFLEGIFKTFRHWEDFSTPEFRELFQRFRSGGEGGEGWQMLVEQNFFIEQLLSGGVGRRLTEAELNYYREPFRQTRSRIPIWRLARSVPVAGEPKDVWDAVSDITERFRRSRLPKLLFYATPGGLITGEMVEWCRQNLRNLETVPVGPGLHYLQESSPHLIGRELAGWYERLNQGR